MKKKKRLHFRKSFQEASTQTVEVYTVRMYEGCEYRLVNLSVGGIAIQRPLEDDLQDVCEFREGDHVFIDLSGLGIDAKGVSAQVVRNETFDGNREFGLSFMTESTQLKHAVEKAIGWSEVTKSLNKPRSTRTVYGGEPQGRELPAWLESIIPFRSGRLHLENPLRAKRHLIEWIEDSVDSDQLEVTISQAM